MLLELLRAGEVVVFREVNYILAGIEHHALRLLAAMPGPLKFERV
jgi:hypothetical protein